MGRREDGKTEDGDEKTAHGRQAKIDIATAIATATATAARPHFQALKMAPSDLKYPLFLFRAFSLLNFNFVASL